MARTEARIKSSIWSDDDFNSLSSNAKLLYFVIISQPTVNFCGVISQTPKRFSSDSGLSVQKVNATLKELSEGRFIFIDDTEEILIRSFIKHDGVLAQPNIIRAMAKDWVSIRSKAIKAQILDFLGCDFLNWLVANHPKTFKAIGEGLPEGFVEGFRKHFEEGLPEGFPRAFPLPHSPMPLAPSPSSPIPHSTHSPATLPTEASDADQEKAERVPTAISLDFELTAEMEQVALDVGLDNFRFHWSEFVPWYAGKGTKAVDWVAMWKSWCVRKKADQDKRAREAGLEDLDVQLERLGR